MKTAIVIVLTLALFALAANYLLQDNGYVLINFGGYAIEMSVPVLLLMLLGSTSLMWMLMTDRAAPLLVSTVAVSLLGAAMGLAWMRVGRDIIRLRDLLAITGYCALRLPSFVRFFTRRQVEWIRTERP